MINPMGHYTAVFQNEALHENASFVSVLIDDPENPKRVYLFQGPAKPYEPGDAEQLIRQPLTKRKAAMIGKNLIKSGHRLCKKSSGSGFTVIYEPEWCEGREGNE